MLLVLLRHGDAVQHPSLHDRDRPLTPLGLTQAHQVATFLKAKRIAIERIITSPLLRAQQMAGAIQQALGLPTPIVSEALVPDSNPANVLALLNSSPPTTVLLVGHEPHLSSTASILVAQSTNARIEIKKASLACIESPTPLERGSGTLTWLLPVNLFDAIGS